jgi:hypothetical glycosyl hydrolase
MFHYDVEKTDHGLFLVEKSYDPRFNLKTESVFASCNGFLGVRASFDSRVLDEDRGMFVHGLYDRAFDHDVRELVKCPDLTEMRITIGGESVSVDASEVLSYRRALNVGTGELEACLVLRLGSGIRIRVDSRRFASFSDRSLFVQQVEVTPLDADAGIGIVTGIDGQVTNSGVSHFREMVGRVYDRQHVSVRASLLQGGLQVVSTPVAEGPVSGPPGFHLTRRGIFGEYRFHAGKAETVRITKYSLVTRLQAQEEEQEELVRKMEGIIRQGYEGLLEAHRGAFGALQRDAGIVIDGATPEEEAALAFAQYHLMGMAPAHTDRVSIGAKGLTGEGYRGHVFWDTEMFILPFFQHNFPDTARNLLTFRYHGLEGARRKARTFGYDGAMFPWEVTDDGDEETPLYAALNIHTGRAAKVWSGILEHHVTADIAYALWDYYLISRDDCFMKDYGYRILVEASLFWVSRAEYREVLERYEILGVIGPDEYTEHVDNNAYTNHMAHFCVRTTLDALEKFQENDPSGYAQLAEELELEEKKAKMSDFVARLYLPGPDEDGIIPQDDTFLSKRRLEDISKYRESQLKQAILRDFSRDEVVGMQVLKQADVVMLLNLFPDLFPHEVIRKNVEFYEQRTIHDSSLSYSAHAQAMASIGERDAALSFFRKAIETDLSDNPLDSRDGIHAAALGGIWNAVVFGFAGFSHDEQGIRLSPQLPGHWRSIAFRTWVWGRQLQIRVTKDEATVECLTKCPESLEVNVGERTYGLAEKLQVAVGHKVKRPKAVIFDLDGVVADTSVYHYLAWRDLAKELGFDFSKGDNEQLKGVSRMASLELVLKAGRIEGMTDKQKESLAQRKNEMYLRMIGNIDEKSILPGIMDFLKLVRDKGYRTALGSASRSGRLVVERLGITGQFDVIVDGNMVSVPKPDPEVFKRAADLLHTAYQDCIVVEDAAAGVEAAKAGGMRCIGIGDACILKAADTVVEGTADLVRIDLDGLSRGDV